MFTQGESMRKVSLPSDIGVEKDARFRATVFADGGLLALSRL
jgi:hypothetical protein